MVGAEENDGRPERRPRRRANVRGAFSELASETEAMSWAKIDPTKVFGRSRGRLCLSMVRNGELPKESSAKGGGAWGRREGGLSPPRSMPCMAGAWFARRR